MDNPIAETEEEPLVAESEVSQDFTSKIYKAQSRLLDCGSAYVGEEFDKINPLVHTFADGMYIRQITMPAGQIIVSKIHGQTHPYFILKGDVSVLTEDGVKRYKAPYSGITEAGTKRVLYTHEDTVWTTVQRTNETDLDKIEEDVMIKETNMDFISDEGIDKLLEGTEL
jgi:hypothetical protein